MLPRRSGNDDTLPSKHNWVDVGHVAGKRKVFVFKIWGSCGIILRPSLNIRCGLVRYNEVRTKFFSTRWKKKGVIAFHRYSRVREPPTWKLSLFKKELELHCGPEQRIKAQYRGSNRGHNTDCWPVEIIQSLHVNFYISH